MSLPTAAAGSTPCSHGRGIRPGVRVGGPRSQVSSARAELFVASFGLFLCTGLPENLAPSEFRLVKHAFYALIMGLLLLRWQATLRVATRDWALCLFAGLLLSSALWSEQPAWAFKSAAVIVQTTGFGLYLASRFSLDEQLRALSGVLVLTLLAFVASALLDPVGAFATPGHEGAFRGPLAHKNEAGRLMALAVPVLLLRIGTAPRQRVLVGCALAVAALFLVLSRSLGGLLVAAMLCSVVVVHRFLRPLGAGILLLPTLAVAVGSAAAIGGLLDGVLTALGKDPTLTGRTEIWSHSMRLLSERPLLGHSMASFWQLDIVERTGIWFSNAHNGYLQLLIELGLVGLAVFVFQLLTTLLRSLRWAQLRDRAALWPYCVAAFVLVYNLFEVSLAEENSIVWVLYVAASFAVRSPAARRPAVVEAHPPRTHASRGVRA